MSDIDTTYIIGQLQDAEGELEQADARLTRLEQTLEALIRFHGASKAQDILETPVSEFITT